jgi:hypothetical protein
MQSFSLSRRLWAAPFLAVALLLFASSVAHAVQVVGLTTTNQLVTFDSSSPGTTSSPVAIIGLQTGENLLGIDFRPVTGELYGLGSSGRLYIINPVSGEATLKATLTADPADSTDPFTALSGTSFGVDFNPVPDRLRVTSDAEQNLRINPDNGLVTTDTTLNPGNPNVVGSAYTNSFAGAPSTTLYAIDSGSDTLLIQNPPNNGVLGGGLPLGVDTSDQVGFDITANGNAAFASLTVGGAPQFYRINLAAGGATLIGTIGNGATQIRGIALLSRAANLFAISNDGLNLLQFNSVAPGTILSTNLITGLQGGETILGIDFRPATGELYGLGSTARLYTINTTTGAATLKSTLTADPTDTTSPFTGLNGTSFGVDFNPVPDRLRVTSDAEQSLRINVDNGRVTTDGTLNPGNPNVVGSAYTNSFAGATATTLYDIDSVSDRLATQTPPNDGTLVDRGALGVDTDDRLGFDIASADGTAFAALTVGGTGQLYTIDLVTGAATLLGNIGTGAPLRGLAAALPIAQLSASTFTVAENALRLTVTVTRTGDLSVAGRVNYATSDTFGLAPCTTVNGIASERCDYSTAIGVVSFAAGESSKTFDIFLIDDARVEGNETFTVSLTGAVGFGLSGATTATVTITDNDAAAGSNPIDGVEFFVRQQYIDFLAREPDTVGFANWVNTLQGCPNGGFGLNNPQCDRVRVASGFYPSMEFGERGYFVYRFYDAALGRLPQYREFMRDLQRVGGSQSPAQSEASKIAFIADFVASTEFQSLYTGLTVPAQAANFIAALEQKAGVTLPEPQRSQLINQMQSGQKTAAETLRAFIESQTVFDRFFNRGFVSLLYFGFLRREPDTVGFNNWLTQINQTGDSRPIVFGFIYSTEYRQRFGQP